MNHNPSEVVLNLQVFDLICFGKFHLIVNLKNLVHKILNRMFFLKI